MSEELSERKKLLQKHAEEIKKEIHDNKTEFDLWFSATLQTPDEFILPEQIIDPPKEEGLSDKLTGWQHYLSLGSRLSDKKGSFSFQGLNPKAYHTLKTAEVIEPDRVTPIDILIVKFQTQGFKILVRQNLGDPLVGFSVIHHVIIVPAKKYSVYKDSLLPCHLNITDDMDQDLRSLIHPQYSLF